MYRSFQRGYAGKGYLINCNSEMEISMNNNNKLHIRVGSRDSRLAIAQTMLVLDEVKKHNSDIEFELITMKTTGDKILDRNLDKIGGKGLFVKELDRALVDGKVDITIHSLKDLPMEVNPKLPVIGYFKREDAKDALIIKPGCEESFQNGIIGTSSNRRMVQLKKLYPGAQFKGIRGNVQTRMNKLKTQDYSATVLAMAGLKRLGLESCADRVFEPDELIPAAGQGILAIQGREGGDYSYMECVFDKNAEYEAMAERAFTKALNGGCSSPIAAYSYISGDTITLRGLYYDEVSDDYCTGVKTGLCKDAVHIGEELAMELKGKFTTANAGKVWLIGAGPGDIGLLTQKAVSLIKSADVIIYDALISMEILAILPPDAELINAGKRSSHHIIAQPDINRLLLDKALEGKRVVRLKGGDPFVFGRGGEELELLSKYNIPFEVVPGITSGIAVAAYNGIPVTHRDYTSSFHVITGHKKQDNKLDINFKALVDMDATLVFLMGVAALETICQGLIAAGMRPDTPAAILEKGTTSRQRRVISDIANLKAQADIENIEAPAVIVVGKVCALSDSFAWFEKLPLFGKQIVVTRPQNSISMLTEKLKNLGAQVIQFPTIKTQLITKDDGDRYTESILNAVNKIQHSDTPDCIAFTSPRGVEHFFEQLNILRIDIRRLFANNKLTFAVLGSGTGKALEKYGIYPDYMPLKYSARELGRTLASEWKKEYKKDGTIYIFRALEGSPELNRELDNAGIVYKDIAIYKTVYETGSHLKDKMYETFNNKDIDYVMFTSASTVRGFVKALPQLDYTQVNAVCIGEQTASCAKEYGMNIRISKEAAIDSLIDVIMDEI